MGMINLMLDLVMVVCLWCLCGFFALSIPDRQGLRFDSKFAELLGVVMFPCAILYLYTVKRYLKKE